MAPRSQDRWSEDRSGPHPTAWTPVRGGRASVEVAAQIRAAFFNGMRPGDWLGTENELAEQFGVSRITMRDAVRMLEAQGIVDVKVGARGGLRIAHGDPDRFSDALAVQAHLLGVSWEEIAEAMRSVEAPAARLAAERRGEADLETLERHLQQQRAAVDDRRQFHQAASDFHLTLAKASHNPALYVAARALRLTHDRLLEPEATPRNARLATQDHTHLLEAVRNRDGNRAEALMRDHLDAIGEQR